MIIANTQRIDKTASPGTLSKADNLKLARASIAHKRRLGIPVPQYELRRLADLTAVASTEGK